MLRTKLQVGACVVALFLLVGGVVVFTSPLPPVYAGLAMLISLGLGLTSAVGLTLS